MGCLRLFLAIAVVLSHTDYQGPRMIKGHDAVHVFFVISGFYMAMILRRKYGFSTQGLGSFAANRFLRLYPCYLAVMMATIGWAAFCHWSTRGEAAIHKIIQAGDMLPLSALVLLWLPNLILLGIDLPAWFELRGDRDIIFANPETNGALWLGETLWVPQAWSIGSEIWFYMLAPMAMAGSAMKKRPRWRLFP
jgi:peptidoglycan/LPS O-acetylase OafA/YrhL